MTTCRRACGRCCRRRNGKSSECWATDVVCPTTRFPDVKSSSLRQLSNHLRSLNPAPSPTTLCRVKGHCHQRGLRWSESLARTACGEQEYYEDLVRFCRSALRVRCASSDGQRPGGALLLRSNGCLLEPVLLSKQMESVSMYESDESMSVSTAMFQPMGSMPRRTAQLVSARLSSS